jgi:glycosyltransferase involved in cell wall biosynthesis
MIPGKRPAWNPFLFLGSPPITFAYTTGTFMRIHYISYGTSETGGYRHEKTMFDALRLYLAQSATIKARDYRKNKLFTSIAAYVELLSWAFFRSSADINIVTARTAIPAMIRNAFNKKEVWIVLHNYDPEDGKSTLLASYYKRLFSKLQKCRHHRFKVIAVSPFWVRYFTENVGLPNVYHFPNLLNAEFYLDFRHTHKESMVHLGQFSSKNDPNILRLANQLSADGYTCFFSTLNPAQARPHNGSFDIRFFDDFTDYLDTMSRCCCTLALTRINEGWNRVAHESILVGTPVIGYAKGGLGDLLKASNSISVKNTDEAYVCIREALWVLPDDTFTDAYDISRAPHYLQPICNSLSLY